MSRIEDTDNVLVEKAMTLSGLSPGVSYMLTRKVDRPDVYNCKHPRTPILRVTYEVFVGTSSLGLANVVDYMDSKDYVVFKALHSIKDDEG